MRRVRLAVAAALLAWSPAALAATPPAQPAKGPGGQDYVSAEVVKRGFGQASAPVYVFHGAGKPAQARPVVVFLHAWGATNPQVYGGWIEHLARRGHLVIFPRFQDVNRTRPADATANAVEGVKTALAALKDDDEARPDLKRVALVGHLAGAGVAANLAALAKAQDLPRPDLVFSVMPGGLASDPKSRGILLEDLSKVDDSTLLVAMVGDRDHAPSQRAAQRLMKEATGVPAERKAILRALSDDHGFPTIVATLASPASPKEAYDGTKIAVPADPAKDPKAQRLAKQKWSADMNLSGEQITLNAQIGANATDTMDYLAYWKTLDLALQAAFARRDAAALRAMPELFDMGRWSDGWPVRRLGVVEVAK